MEYRQEPGNEDGDPPAAIDVVFRANPVPLPDAMAEATGLDLRAEIAPEGKTDALAGQEPRITAARSAKYSTWPATAVLATITIVSPGTMRPTNTDVSKNVPVPASTVRNIGSTD